MEVNMMMMRAILMMILMTNDADLRISPMRRQTYGKARRRRGRRYGSTIS